jgi:hypothetical protein
MEKMLERMADGSSVGGNVAVGFMVGDFLSAEI